MQTISPEPERDAQAARVEPSKPAARGRGNGGFAVRTLWLFVILAVLAGGYAWYDQRRAVQAAFIVIVGLTAAAGVAGLGWWIRTAWRRYWLAAVGAAYLAVFITLRAASFHHVDSVLYNLPGIGMNANRALELSGILLIVWSAWRVARTEPRGSPRRKRP